MWYVTGTVSVTNGSGTVVGVNTLWTLNAAAGDLFFGPDDRIYQITAVADDTHMSIRTRAGQDAYQGSTLSAQEYAIIRNFTNSVNATLASKLTNLLNTWQTREDEFRAWHGGSANGGPAYDGNYPLTDAVGVSQDIACPAKLMVLAGGQVKQYVKAASTANLTLSGEQTVDGVALVTGDRCFVKDQTTASQNGIYVVAGGAWTRAADFDASADAFPQCLVPVEQGTANGDSIWMMTTNGPITLGSTSLAFAQVYPDPNKPTATLDTDSAFAANSDTRVPSQKAVKTALDLKAPLSSPAFTTPKSTTTIGVGNATPAASGAGITFPATQSVSSDANTLDDYEEGTFTATLKGGTTDPTTPVTVTAYYRKIGALVFVYGYFSNVNTTGASGYVSISGIPFAVSGGGGGAGSMFASGFGSNPASIWAAPGGSILTPLETVSSNNITHVSPGSSKYLMFSATYMTA